LGLGVGFRVELRSALTKVDEGFADFMTEASCKVRRFRVLRSKFWVWV
jgi:hypothetical protein